MASVRQVRAYLGLGGNIGDPARAMASALQALDAHEGVVVAAVSSSYKTPPWGVTDQPDFINAVAALDTTLSARQLIELCLETERNLKRERTLRWGPRSIDIDILIYGDETIDEEGLQVPHPRMADRAFVLAPLSEIAPDVLVFGESAQSRLAGIDAGGIVKLPGGSDWWRV